jgi:hypothetical protein
MKRRPPCWQLLVKVILVMSTSFGDESARANVSLTVNVLEAALTNEDFTLSEMVDQPMGMKWKDLQFTLAVPCHTGTRYLVPGTVHRRKSQVRRATTRNACSIGTLCLLSGTLKDSMPREFSFGASSSVSISSSAQSQSWAKSRASQE